MSVPSLRELFDEAVELDAAARGAFLDARCADPSLRERLERLLAADEAPRDGLPTTPAAGLAAAIGEAPAPRPRHEPGTRVGPFELGTRLGEGGFASVYRAHRVSDGVRQDVALKLLHRGLHTADAQRQFRRERLALARLEHPNIARLIEGGVTDGGLAYIALELVEGEPITAHASARALGLRERIALFLEVCRAVEAAHRALIVHRDLKPSNVLVTPEGRVKLLDFGIAKRLEAADDETRTQMPAFTPAYAAPEQRTGGAATTATDVYALGVLLGELLTGRRLDAESGREASASIATLDGAPADAGALPPDQLRRALRGDLDRVIAKALAADPEDRYAGAGAFADDLERWLRGEPVAAHPPSRAYRARKFVVRHRYGVAIAALVAVAVLASLGVALWQAGEARREAARANASRDLLVGVFESARAQLPRDQRPTPEALVEQARLRLAAAAPLDPATRAELLVTLAEVELSLAQYARAQQSLDAAEPLLAARGDAAALARLRVLRAEADQRAGRAAEAIAAIDAELPALRAAPTPLLPRALAVRAAASFDRGDPEPMLADLREAAAASRALDGEASAAALAAELAVGNGLAQLQRYPEAVAALAPALERWRRAGHPQDDRYVAALSNLAVATDGVGDLPGAEARYRELLESKRAIYTAPHGAIATTLRDLAVTLSRAGRHDEARARLDEALASDRAVYGNDHREVAADHDILGNIEIAQRRYAEADAAYREALAICARGAIREEVCPRARNNLGMSAYRQGDLATAEREMTQALEERRALFGDDHPTVAFSLSTLANVAAKRGDGGTALRLSAEAIATLERAGRGGSREAALIRNGLAQALYVAERNDEALAEIDRTLADWQRVAPDALARRVMMLVLKAQILRAMGQDREARAVAREAAALGVDPADLSEATRALLEEFGARAADAPAG